MRKEVKSMKYNYRTRGVCAMDITFDIDGDKVHNVRFYGGCDGNLKAICKLIEGMKAEQVVKILEGNTCGFRPTSCADQLSIALREALAEESQTA